VTRPISTQPLGELRTVPVLDSQMAYVEVGSGEPIVFLHGNPTSSYLWRNVMPHLEGLGRILAPDLIGMGASGPATGGSYRFVDHRRYLDAWLQAVGATEHVTLVVHDWGSGLGFDWARRHASAVKAIAYMEAIVKPMPWDDWPDAARSIFQAMRSEAGEEIILQKNVFVERILPSAVLRQLSDEEMAVYRAPFAEPGESRRPTLTWPREIPVGGEPLVMVEIVGRYAEWLSTCDVPKLFINAEPGSILVGAQREFARSWPNQREVTVPGRHFIQEDSPHEIGEAIREWLTSLDDRADQGGPK
jgi:haloalkane dehalogenase